MHEKNDSWRKNIAPNTIIPIPQEEWALVIIAGEDSVERYSASVGTLRGFESETMADIAAQKIHADKAQTYRHVYVVQLK